VANPHTGGWAAGHRTGRSAAFWRDRFFDTLGV
jgi:hypothetical protein